MTRKFKKGQVVYFAVAGTGDFPFDMLRYDQCWPATENDSRSVGLGWAVNNNIQVRKIILATYYRQETPSPTHRRWSSFTWTTGGFCENLSEAA